MFDKIIQVIINNVRNHLIFYLAISLLLLLLDIYLFYF